MSASEYARRIANTHNDTFQKAAVLFFNLPGRVVITSSCILNGIIATISNNNNIRYLGL